MYTLELDLNLLFVPPMKDYGPGIILTRTIPIPIQPTSGLVLCGRVLEEFGPTEMGFKLEDVKWDLDREVFLATTSLTNMDLPIAFIPDTIRAFTNNGWRVGSYTDAYPEEFGPDERDAGDEMPADAAEGSAVDHERQEVLHELPQNKRPKDFNRLFKALIREMALAWNNISTAYAMDKLRRFVDVSEEQRRLPAAKQTPLQRQWITTLDEFSRLDADQQWTWREKVLGTYPSIEDVI